MSDNQSKNTLIPIWIFSAMAIGLLLGFMVRNYTYTKKVFHPFTKFSELDEVLFYVKDQYVDSVDIEDFEEKVIEETLNELDPHSVYLNKDILAREIEQIDGEYEGIGIEFFIVEDTVTVVTAMSGGPSESVGIRAGDKIVSVEEESIAGVGIENDDVIKLLKGKKGTKVNVGIKRGRNSEIMDFKITRAPIAINSVDVAYMINSETGFIKVNTFSKETSKEFRIELNKLAKKGMKNLILDLRDNRGGILDDALYMVDELLTDNRIMLTAEGEHYKRKDYKSQQQGAFEQGKIAVLINENSASASEIVAGAIQDWDRGLVIGRRSFGKGLVQNSYQLQDGSVIRLTVARYYTPSGRSIQRSYENGSDAYYQNHLKRATSGELFHKDSIKIDTTKAYKTLIHQRNVYGGGGILPDVFVPADTTANKFVNAVYSNGILQEFAFDYFSNNEASFSGFNDANDFEDQFFVNNNLYEQLVDYTDSKSDIAYSEESKRMGKSQVTLALKSLFARQLFGDEGFYLVSHQNDDVIDEALKQFNSSSYNQILNPAE